MLPSCESHRYDGLEKEDEKHRLKPPPGPRTPVAPAFARPKVPSRFWGQVSGPSAVAFTDPTNPQTLVTFTEPGEYVLRLTADDLDLSASDEVTFIVIPPNQAPTVNSGADESIILPVSGKPAVVRGVVSIGMLPRHLSLLVSPGDPMR